MAHFAKIGIDNKVLTVLSVDTINTMTNGGIEKEEIGVAYLTKHHGHEVWKKCSYNTKENRHMLGGTPFRANFPGVDWIYNSTHDIFHPPQPIDKDGEICSSWTLDTVKGVWNPPIVQPTVTNAQKDAGTTLYQWDESLYKSDNTKGWVLT